MVKGWVRGATRESCCKVLLRWAMGCTENNMGAMLVPLVEGLQVEGLQVEGRSYKWRGRRCCRWRGYKWRGYKWRGCMLGQGHSG